MLRVLDLISVGIYCYLLLLFCYFEDFGKLGSSNGMPEFFDRDYSLLKSLSADKLKLNK